MTRFSRGSNPASLSWLKACWAEVRKTIEAARQENRTKTVDLVIMNPGIVKKKEAGE